jgi:uncharacterized Zn finger protein
VSYYEWGWKPYVPVAERRRKAARAVEKRRKQGHSVSPVVIQGRTIATTFWGKAWCDNLERYSDYANRLPRGRTYVRNGSVVDLQIAAGSIRAIVSGSELYEVALKIAPLAKARWKSICDDCAGAIDSVVELLRGRFSKGVMERVCRQNQGLFPSPAEIKLSCSCPDWAGMCKHVAAVLYGIGARFDQQPELLFRLREVDEQELIVQAGSALPFGRRQPVTAKVLGRGDLADVFGLDMAPSAGPEPATPKRAKAPAATEKKTKRRPGKRAARKPGRQRKATAAKPQRPAKG